MNYLPVKIIVVISAMIVLCGLTPAQTNDFDVDAMLDSAQQFAQDNLDPDVLRALQNVDRQKVGDFLNHYQDYLQGDYVLDVAQLKEGGKRHSAAAGGARGNATLRGMAAIAAGLFRRSGGIEVGRATAKTGTGKTLAAATESNVPGGAANLDQKSFAASVAEKRCGIRAEIKNDFHGGRRAGGTGLAGRSGIRF